MTTLMEEELDSESGSDNGMLGVDINNFSKEKQGTLGTQERSGTTREALYSGCFRHEQVVSITIRECLCSLDLRNGSK